MIGMVLGVVFGAVFTQFEGGDEIISDWIKPFGIIFINTLKLIAMPLILGSLIKGVSDLKDISKLSLMGGKTIGIYLLTTILAVSIGLFMVNTIRPGNSIADSTRMDLIASYESDAAEKYEVAQKQKEAGPLQALIDLVPDNIFKATTENGNMLQVIFFALFFGLIFSRKLKKKKQNRTKKKSQPVACNTNLQRSTAFSTFLASSSQSAMNSTKSSFRFSSLINHYR